MTKITLRNSLALTINGQSHDHQTHCGQLVNFWPAGPKNGPNLKKVTLTKLLHHATGDRWTLDMTDRFCPIQKKGQEHCWWTIHWAHEQLSYAERCWAIPGRKEPEKSQLYLARGRTFFALTSAPWLLHDYKWIDPLTAPLIGCWTFKISTGI